MTVDDTSPETRTDDGSEQRATSHAADPGARPMRVPPIPDRYAALDLSQGAVIIYDRSETDAWIQSTDARSLERTA